MGVVSQRLAMYQEAVRAAEENGESNKARRYKRGVTTLEQVIRGLNLGVFAARQLLMLNEF